MYFESYRKNSDPDLIFITYIVPPIPVVPNPVVVPNPPNPLFAVVAVVNPNPPKPLLALVVVVVPNPPKPLLTAVVVVPKPPKPLLAAVPNPAAENKEPVPPALKILDAVVFVTSPNPKK
jgi:hypothetical protein